MILLTLAALGVVGFGAPARAFGQSGVDGAIAGHVVQATGEEIAGAQIRLEGEDGSERTAVTGRHGEFYVVRLTPGQYTLTARAPGFRGRVELEVAVELGRTTELEVGRTGAVIRKRDRGRGAIRLEPMMGTRRQGAKGRAAELLERGSTLERDPGAAVVALEAVDGLPVAGRQWSSVALTAPAVQADPDADGQTLLTVRGLEATENSSQIDGLSHDQSFGAVPVGTGAGVGKEAEDDAVGGGNGPGGGLSGGSSGSGLGQGRRAGAAYTFSQGAVREFRLSEQGYSAVYGHGAGAVSAAVSRSGSNALHGAGFYTLRQSGLGAANPFSIATSYADGATTSSVVKPPDRREQFGGTVGGPICRDRVFYFAAYDEQRRDFPAVSSPSYAGFYSLTAMQTGLLGNRGVTRAKTNAALNYLSSLTGILPRRQDQRVIFGKVDGHLGSRNTVSVQVNRARWTSPNGGTTAAVVARGRASLGSADGQVDEYQARWTSLLGGGLSNEVRVGWGRDFQYEAAQQPLAQEAAIGPGGLAPEISIGPQGLVFGTPSALGRKAYPDERRTQFVDTIGWVRRRHFLRVGGDVSLVHDLVDALNNQEGRFSYDSGVTGGKAGGLVDWITDYTFDVHAYPNGACPSIAARVHDFCFRSFSQSFGEQTTSFSTTEMAGFVQDDWHVRPGLTVNVGVRYEFEVLPPAQAPNAALDAVFSKTGVTSVLPADHNNYGPRVGVSWQPFGGRGWVIHAGYGLYFGRLPGTTVRSALVDTALAASTSSTTHVRITPGTETVCPQVAGQGFGYVCTYVTAPPAAVGVTTSATVFDSKFQLPAVQQGSFTVEHEVGAGIAASVSYRMNMDRQLPNSRDINIAPSTRRGIFQLSGGTGAVGVKDGEQFVVPVYTARVTPKFGPVTDIISNGNGTYNAVVAEVRRRTRGGLDLRVSWTWSKALDYGQTGGGVPRTNGQFDPFEVGYDRGPSGLNFPHRVVASAVWSPRVDTDTLWMRSLANGWSVAPIFLESSGRGYSYGIFGGTRLSGGRESINGSGGASYLPTVGRNTLRLPDRMNVDLRVSRTVKLSERVRVKGVAEAFNLMNRVNYSGLQQRAFLVGTAAAGVTPLVFQDAAAVAKEGLSVQPFGTFTAAGTVDARERQVQLGLRLEF